MDPTAASALSSQIVAGYSESGLSQLPYETINFIYTTPIQKLHFKDVVERFSNIVINDGDDPSEVWRSLKLFYNRILEPEIDSAFQGYTSPEMKREGYLKKLIFNVKMTLEFPALGITKLDNFMFLYHDQNTKSHGSSNYISRLCLDKKVIEDISYEEISNEYFTQKVVELIERIGSESLQMDGSTLRKSIKTLDEYWNIFHESRTAGTLNETNITVWFSEMIIGPVVELLNIVVGKRQSVIIENDKREQLTISTYQKEGKQGNLLKINNDKFYTYPDRTLLLLDLVQNTVVNLMNIEIKMFNCIKPFTERKGVIYESMMLQLLSQIISGNFGISALCDGYHILLYRLDLESENFGMCISNADNIGFIPIQIKMCNVQGGDYGFPNAKKALSAMLFDEIQNIGYQTLKQNRIELLKTKCLKSTSDLIESFKTWNQEFYPESVNFESHKVAHQSNSRNHKTIEIYSNGPQKNPQMLILTKGLCQEMFGIKIDGNWDKKMLLKVFDPSRYQIQNYVPELHKSKILDTKRAFELMYDQEIEAYNTVQHFNHNATTKINIPTRYTTGALKLEVTGLSYYAGHYLLYDFISGRPFRRSHYRKGMKQLQLLKKAKIEPNYIEPSNIYYENGKFYISDLCHSTLGDRASQSSNYELNLNELEVREKVASS